MLGALGEQWAQSFGSRALSTTISSDSLIFVMPNGCGWTSSPFPRYMHRFWAFTESWLGKGILLKTERSFFDLNAILECLYRTVNSDDHPYFPVFKRLAPLRPLPQGQRYWVTSPARPDSTEQHVFVYIYSCSDGRACDVDVDEAKALFPVLDLKWVSG